MRQRRAWRDLTPEEQLRLREAFSHYLDGLPATCSLDNKIRRFQQWLEERDILFERKNLSR